MKMNIGNAHLVAYLQGRPLDLFCFVLHATVRRARCCVLHFSMQPFGAPAVFAGLAPPRVDADAHGHYGGGAVSRAWAVLFQVEQ